MFSGKDHQGGTVNETEINSIRESLLFQKGSILNKTHEFKLTQSSRELLADEAEAASHDISDNISIHLHERDRKSLLMIERALTKIAGGTYGQCESCGEQIGARRLQVHPLTAMCIECMEENEDLKNRFQ